MPLPEFTSDEQYVIDFVKSPKASSLSIAWMCGYLSGGIVIAGFAAYLGSVPMMGTAFVVVCCFRIWEEWYQTRWLPLWRSIIAKYEAAVVDNGNASRGDFNCKP